MIILMLILSIAAYVSVMLIMGGLSKNVFHNTRDRLLYQVIMNGLSLVLMILIFRAVRPSGYTLMLSAFMGGATLLSSVFSLMAYQLGPVSISVLINTSLAMVIGAAAGPLFWGESISFLQILGIILSIASMTLMTEKTLVQKASVAWIAALLLASIGGGLQGVIQKALTASVYASQNYEFITYTFFFNALASLIIFFCTRSKEKESVSFRMNAKLFGIFGLASALAVFLNINNLRLVAELPTVVFFPSYSIGGLLVTTVASLIIFKEKMSGRQIAGFIAGLAALLLVSGILG